MNFSNDCSALKPDKYTVGYDERRRVPVCSPEESETVNVNNIKEATIFALFKRIKRVFRNKLKVLKNN